MANPVQDILWRFVGDSRDFLRDSRKVRGDLEQTSRTSSKATTAWSGMKKALTGVGVAFGAFRAAQWAQDAVGLAVAAEEVDSKFQAVYGTSEDLTAQLEEWGNMAGVTTTEGKELAATFGNLAQAQGISLDESKRLALEVASLAGDMASFNDQDPAMVFNDLNKALLTTEREGMKKYGIAITEAEVKTRAAAIATEDGRDEVTKADRAYASYAIAVEQSGKAIGDLERTQDSAANKVRQQKADFKELQEEIGIKLVPVLEDLLEVLNTLAPVIITAADAAGRVVDPVSAAAEETARLREEARKAGEEGRWWAQGLKYLQAEMQLVGPMTGKVREEVEQLESAQLAAEQSTSSWADQLQTGAVPALEATDLKLGTSAGEWVEFAGAAVDAVGDIVDATEEGKRRVAAAVDEWGTILADLAGAYEAAAVRIANTQRGATFLGPAEGFAGAGNPYAPGYEGTKNQEAYRRVNGLD